MRLDKLVGKASMIVKVKVYDWDTNNCLFFLLNAADFDDVRKDMKKYRVKFYSIEHDAIVIFVKKKED